MWREGTNQFGFLQERRSGAEKQRKKVAIKPVDEDLYKIPPELIQKPRRVG